MTDKPEPVGEIRTYNAIDFMALTLLLTDRKLHAACDQADSGFWLKEAFEKTTKANCHKLWDELPADQKSHYRKSARAYIFGNKEISQLSRKKWEKF